MEEIAAELRRADAELGLLRQDATANAGKIGQLESELARLKAELASEEPTPPPPPGPPTPPPPVSASNIEGFGAAATGGSSVYRVTNLNDSGSGSLRDGLSQSGRRIVFEIGGTIPLKSNLRVPSNTTIDGTTAASPGITLRDRILDLSGVQNIIVRSLRHRKAPDGSDAVRVYKSSKIALDHLSISDFGDGSIDVTESSSDVTIQWCTLGRGVPSHNFVMLISYKAKRVSLHHNLFWDGTDRQPNVSVDDQVAPTASELICDVRCNLVWGSKQRSCRVSRGGTANVVNNYYHGNISDQNHVNIEKSSNAVAYVAGNVVHGSSMNVNDNGNRSSPFPAPPITQQDAKTAAKLILAQAGARSEKFGLDQIDKDVIARITI